MTEDELTKQKQWAAQRAMAILEEHFENVVVIVSVPFPGDRTLKMANHHGDVYTCIGMATVFAKKLTKDMAEAAE